MGGASPEGSGASGVPLDNEPDRDEFARLLARHSRQLYSFIMTLSLTHHDAEEVFQNTCVFLWSRFAEFRPGTSFFAWASRIAYYEVLNLMKQKRRTPKLSVEAVDILAEEAAALSDRYGDRIEALADCLSRLTIADREIIQDRYFYQHPPKKIASLRSRSLDSVYRALSRIHHVLLECVERHMARQER
ncbi:sigma-70 family RNA polymerase sigma factor [Lacipirellula sp.]|uniref:sigma-70 family RNA polymerase sigma factor n=1 Tax=Lacipirellula sp. TaxID=2691419 RepID=UPI003D0D2B46